MARKLLISEDGFKFIFWVKSHHHQVLTYGQFLFFLIFSIIDLLKIKTLKYPLQEIPAFQKAVSLAPPTVQLEKEKKEKKEKKGI